jgi:hypothetical protein
VRIWDGVRQPGLFRYPPNTLCGVFTTLPRVQKFSTDYALEMELNDEAADRRTSLAFNYRYINTGATSHLFGSPCILSRSKATGGEDSWHLPSEFISLLDASARCASDIFPAFHSPSSLVHVVVNVINADVSVACTHPNPLLSLTH